MEMYMKAYTKKEKQQAREYILGKMVLCMKEIL